MHEAVRPVKKFCEKKHIHTFRADTQKENKPMQRVFEREGFACCNTVVICGGTKLAYELEW